MRYELLTLVDKLKGEHNPRCIRCGKKLTENELKYYGNSCDNCEGILMRKWTKE